MKHPATDKVDNITTCRLPLASKLREARRELLKQFKQQASPGINATKVKCGDFSAVARGRTPVIVVDLRLLLLLLR